MVGWLGMVGGITLNLCDPNEILDKNNHKYSIQWRILCGATAPV